MGLQLIFLVESNSKVQSDWIYIKETIEKFFFYDRAQTKFSPIFMNGKGNYIKKEKDALELKRKYNSVSKNNITKIIYCVDCDDYDIKIEDKKYLKDIEKFCKVKNYELVWFCKDIERVYLDLKVEENQKGKFSTSFKANKQIENIGSSKLSSKTYKNNTSNILTILNKYLKLR